MKYAIVIPAYNEEATIYELLSEIRKRHSEPIIVIDDGSDKEVRAPRDLENIHILKNDKNKGKGYSILRGLKFSNKLKCTHSMTLDADKQHSPKNIEGFINSCKEYDLVLGYRVFERPMPVHRILSNKITTYIVSKISKFKIKDSQSGFRLYKNSIIKNLSFKEKGFQFESELFFRIDKGSKIKQIPIDVIYSNKKSHINNTLDTLRFIKLIMREIFYGK